MCSFSGEHYSGDSSVVSVIVRNNDLAPLRNARIMIHSNVPIEGKTAGVQVFDANEVNYEIPKLEPYLTLGEELFFSISVATPQSSKVGFVVTMSGENLKRYAATGVIQFVKPRPAP